MASRQEQEQARRYQFGPPEDRSLLAGLRPGQLAVVTVAAVTAVGLLRSLPPGSAIPAAVAVLLLGGAAAFWQVGGRTVEEWTPVAGRWALRRLTGRTGYRSATPLLGHVDGEPVADPPDTLAGVRILAEPSGHASVGIAHDTRAGTYAAVLAVRGRSFQLADAAEKERRLAGWGGVIGGLARASSPVHRLQWVERTVPDDGDAMGQYLARSVRVPSGHPSLSSYLELVDVAGPVTQQHETYLVVAISLVRARRAIRQAGGGDAGAARVLMRELSSLGVQLRNADVIVDGALTPRLLAAALRTGFEPAARQGLTRRASAAAAAMAGDEGGTAPANAWPLAAETSWGWYRVAGAYHATYWVAHWPRTPVGPDFLAPLLLGTTAMRTVAVTMEPVSPLKAHREVESAMVKGLADDELRRRAGFTSTARRRRERESVQRREQELADGHRDYRLTGFVTVTATTLDELEVACGEVEQAAQQSYLELRRMYGEQDAAFTCTLPLGRGLR